MTYVKDWKAKELLAEVSGRIVRGMDKACDFAAEQARAKAARGATKRLSEGIDYEVEARGKTVTGYVGVKGGKGSPYYGYFVELGTKKMAAQPFLRPAVFENGAKIVKLIAEG